MKGSQRGPPTHQHNFVMSDVLNSNFVSEESEHEMVSRLTGVAEARPNCNAQTVASNCRKMRFRCPTSKGNYT